MTMVDRRMNAAEVQPLPATNSEQDLKMEPTNKAELKIIRDSREQCPFTFAGYPVVVEVAVLEAGDYSLAGFERRVAVERKELGDLIGCLSGERERFERELARLRGYDCAAVVVEASSDDLRAGRYRSKLDAGAAWQSVLAFSMRYRVPFIFCQDREDAEAVTFNLLRHYHRDRARELQALTTPSKVAAMPRTRAVVENDSTAKQEPA